MKNEIFFGEKGLTSTSANTIANLAKEYYQGIEQELQSINFVEENVTTAGNNYTLARASSKELFNSIENKLDTIAKCKSLIAWLREAIKARDNVTKEIENLSMSEWCDKNNITYPERPRLDDILTESDYWDSLGADQRNRYYWLETQCAVIGSYIHTSGHYAAARLDAVKKENHPFETSGSGRDLMVYTYLNKYTKEEIDSKFFDLQQKHRDIQKQLNKMKYDCELAIQQSKTQAVIKLENEQAIFKAELDKIQNEFSKWKLAELKKVQDLKIIVPAALKPVYELVSNIGK